MADVTVQTMTKTQGLSSAAKQPMLSTRSEDVNNEDNIAMPILSRDNIYNTLCEV